MKRAALVSAAILLMAVVLISCRVGVTVSKPDDGNGPTDPGPTGPGITIPTWPVADPLTGDLPVGRWECWFEHTDFDRTATSNHGFVPSACRIALLTDGLAMSLHPDYSGHFLLTYSEDGVDEVGDGVSERGKAPDTAFRVEGSDLLYVRGAEMRWSYEDSVLNLQTRRNDTFRAEVLSDDVIRLRQGSNKRLLFRIGSDASHAMAAFRQCVEENDGRNLFDVVPCVNPLPAKQ